MRTHDDLLDAIHRRLDDQLDPDMFEACACDLLRADYRTLVPVRGGGDDGFDGAIASEAGAYPLICTTAQKGPFPNFRKNIERYLDKCRGPKKAVIATQRRVTPKQRQQLVKIAETQYDVTIVQIHDRDDFASRLYSSTRWQKDLLHLQPAPRALSPRPPRPRSESPSLVGREADLDWLESVKGDALIVGQPGIGKTCLHQALVERGVALFAVRHEESEIAKELREKEPEVVIVDDAHENRGLLESLRRLREDAPKRFRIHANCWPNSETDVRQWMDIGSDSVRRLGPLKGKQIVELVDLLGVAGPDRLLHLIVDQAKGKPGLAAVLVAAAKRGDVGELWEGKVLADHLLSKLQVTQDRTLLDILGAISLAGERGMAVEEVAVGLGLKAAEVRNKLTSVEFGGLIEVWEPDDQTLICVQPSAIRGGLVRDTFYRPGVKAAVEPFMALLRSDYRRVRDLAHSLMAARQRQAQVPISILLELARSADHDEVWEHLAYVDAETADAVLDEDARTVCAAASGLLETRPGRALPRLLHEAADGYRKVAEDKVGAWIQGHEAGDPGTIRRRRLLLDALEHWDQQAGRPCAQVHDWAIKDVLSPAVVVHGSVPGEDLSFCFRQGLFGHREIDQIAALWPRVQRLCERAETLTSEVRDVIAGWCMPRRYKHDISSTEIKASMRETAQRMLEDILELPCCGTACRHWVREIADSARIELDVPTDPEFELLFGRPKHAKDWRKARAAHVAKLESLAVRMTQGSSASVVHRLTMLERDAASAGFGRDAERWPFYAKIAELANDPAECLREAMRADAPQIMVSHLLVQSLRKRPASVRADVLAMLESNEHRAMASDAVLAMEVHDEPLLDAVLTRIGASRDVHVYNLAHRVNSETARVKLLRHQERSVRAVAAIAEWLREPHGEIPSGLWDTWRAAILDAWKEDEGHLIEILSGDAALAVEWIRRRLQDVRDEHTRDCYLFEINDIIVQASQALSREQRADLLEEIDEKCWEPNIVEALMSGEEYLFRRWLQKWLPTDREMALRPLYQNPGKTWEMFAKAALDMGVSPEELKGTISLSHPPGFYGTISGEYAKWVPVLQELTLHEDRRLRPAAEHGLRSAQEAVERWTRRECDKKWME